MMRKLLPMRILFVAFVIFNFANLTAQTKNIKFNDNWGKQGVTLNQQDQNGLTINASVNSYAITETMVDKKMMQTITTVGVYLQNNEGAPNIPSYSNYIAVPQGAKVVAKIIRKQTVPVNNIDIAPSPVIPFDNDNNPLIYKKDNKIYSKDEYYPKNIVTISKPMKIRGVDVVMLEVSPFQYNPVTKQMIVNKDIEIELQFEGGNGVFGESRLHSRWWDPIIRDAVLNQASIQEVSNKSKGVNETGFEYVIIVPDDPIFISWADSLKSFRNRQGISTTVVTTTEVGGNTVSAIEGYIDNAYNTWDVPPSAVLLMGDYGTSGSTIISPIYDNYCVSDNIFADVDNDQMPDVVLARMTAQNAEQLETMVTKVLNYERNPPTSPDFYNHPITALGWQTERWFQICSETVGGFFKNELGKDPVRINAVYQGNPNTDPWSTATNTSVVLTQFGPDGLGYIPATPVELGGWSGGNAADVNNAINDGAFILQHRDHGGTDGWGEPSYSNSSINGLHNTDLSFIFSINCLTGKYNISGECFAEKFHRYKYNGENSGALGLIAASEVSYSFVNDTYVWGMYDNMFPDFLPTYGTTPDSRGVMPAFGNAGGKYFLQQSSWPYNTNNKEVTYNLFHHHGDAFTVVYSEVPQYLTVVHEPIIIAGETSFNVTADAGSFIALTVNDVIIGTADGTGSPVAITIPAQMPTDVIIVTVTKQNYYRYEATVGVIPPEGPYVIYNDLAIVDNNGIMETGESILATITMKNIGVEQGNNISVAISTVDEFVTITDDSESYGTIDAGATAVVDEGFAWDVANNIPDMHNVTFNIESTDGTDVWNSTMSIIGHAPQLSVGGISVNDDAQGNGNGNFDPGETVEITIETNNDGSVIAENTIGTLLSNSPFVTIENAEYTIGDILSGDAGNAVFMVSISQGTPIGEAINFTFDAQSGEYNAQIEFTKVSGLIVEDWESGEMNQFDWTTGGNGNWFVSDDNPYEGMYCSKSGNISDSQDTWLSIDYEVAVDDTISFYAMVSSEPSYDFLKFYVDNQLIMNWSGEISWRKVDVPISAGSHNFKWQYKKDMSVSGGDDCGRVDYIVFPVPPVTSVFAGADADFCENETLQCNGSETYCDSIRWITSGTGTFTNGTIVNPVYEASADDIDAGSVILSLTGYGPTETLTDSVIFTIAKTPVAYSGETGAACSNEPFNLEEAYAENYTSIVWTTLGDGAFDDSTAVNPNYTVGTTDIENGTTSLLMTVAGSGACEAATSEFELEVDAATEAGAGVDSDICPMLDYTLADAYAINYSGILWTTSGDGTFDDNTIEHPTYSPGENDKVTKEVTLTITASNETVCPTIVDEMLLTLNCTDINDLYANVAIDIYPNPNTGSFVLNLDGAVNQDVVIRIINSVGKIVYSKSNVNIDDNFSQKFDMNVNSGVYTIVIDGESVHTYTKFIVK